MAPSTATAAPLEIRVEQHIEADPVHLYELVSDVTNMGRWSPENRSCKWVKGATGPVVGARFRGSNQAGWRRWSTSCTVVAADPGERFAFEVDFGPFSIARWAYEFHPEGTGTRVVEVWTDRRARSMAKLTGVVVGVPDRVAHNTAGMQQTLANLKAAVEPR